MLTHWQWSIFIPTSIVPGRTVRCLQQKATLFAWNLILAFSIENGFDALWRWHVTRIVELVLTCVFFSLHFSSTKWKCFELFACRVVREGCVSACPREQRARSLTQSINHLSRDYSNPTSNEDFYAVSRNLSRQSLLFRRLPFDCRALSLNLDGICAESHFRTQKLHVSNWPHRAAKEIQPPKWNSNSKQFSKWFSNDFECLLMLDE